MKIRRTGESHRYNFEIPYNKIKNPGRVYCLYPGIFLTRLEILLFLTGLVGSLNLQICWLLQIFFGGGVDLHFSEIEFFFSRIRNNFGGFI